MEFKLSDWIVNEGNIFQLDELELISIMAIQSEISSQIKLQNITSKKDFLTIKLDLSNRTFGTTDLSIEKILIEYLFIEIGSPTHYNMVCMVLDYLSFWLERKYRTNGSAPMYAMSQYKEHYESLKNDYCEQFLDAEETDFINAQLALCNALEKELQKPVYTEFDILEITETPNKFKQELTLTIVKRRAYLNEKLNSLSTTIDAQKPTETKTDRLGVNQIALIHAYTSVQITRENAKEIAAKYGYTAKSSGEGLYQDYTFYCDTANRKGKPNPCTSKKLKNKIKLLESVIEYLDERERGRAIDEIKILKGFEKELG